MNALKTRQHVLIFPPA